jgi:hypothetical protein
VDAHALAVAAAASPEPGESEMESSGTESGDDPMDPPAAHSGGSSEDEPVLKKPTKHHPATTTRRRIIKGGEDKYWLSSTREAVRNHAPNSQKEFILYLPSTPEHFGAKIHIEGDLQLKQLALTRGGTEQYSKEKADFFNKHHRKAKAQLNRSLVLGFATEGEFQMAMNVQCGKNGPMQLHPRVEHLETVEALRNLLNSDALYTDPIVHRLWVGLFQSGIVEGTKRVSPKVKLDEIVDVDYEAHARFELISRMSYQGYKHGYTAAARTARSAGFRQVRKLVRKDRINNLEAAEVKRLSLVTDVDGELSRTQALTTGGLADTTDEEDDF